jgi:hypothetical protein
MNIVLVRPLSNTRKENGCTVQKKGRITTKLGLYVIWFVKTADFQMYDTKVIPLSVLPHDLNVSSHWPCSDSTGTFTQYQQFIKTITTKEHIKC